MRLMNFERITVDPAVCLGKPTIKGTRITVDFVLRLIADGRDPGDVVREYPELTIEDVREAARYAAWLATERTLALG